MKFTLPACIKARRIGHWSYGTDTEYDVNGELAPITLTCNCGSWIKTEAFCETGEYTPVSDFVTNHQACVAKCYNCHTNTVERQGYWCAECDK